MEEVKKELKTTDFYFIILSKIKEGLSPIKISKELDLSIQNLNYYISKLKKEGYKEIEKLVVGRESLFDHPLELAEVQAVLTDTHFKTGMSLESITTSFYQLGSSWAKEADRKSVV